MVMTETLKKKLFINGKWQEAEKFTTLKSPYSGEVLAEIPSASLERCRVGNRISLSS